MSSLRLTRLRVRNFRLFRSLDLEFVDGVNVLIAPNGSGKTTILDAIAVILERAVIVPLSGRQIPAIKLGHDTRRVRAASSGTMEYQLPGLIELTWQAGGNPVVSSTDWESLDKVVSVAGEQSLTEMRVAATKPELAPDTDGANGHSVNDNDPSAIANLPLFAYYPSTRSSELGAGASQQLKPAIASRLDGYSAWRDPDQRATGLTQWFAQRDLAHAQLVAAALQRNETPPTDSTFKQQLDAVNQVARIVLSGGDWVGGREFESVFWSFDDQRLMVRTTKGETFDLVGLSSGWRAVLSLVVDLAARALSLNPHHRELAAEKSIGVVLIDELDLHLHPEWQKKILTSLHSAFPNLQFIITTHSPMMLSAVSSERVRSIGVDGSGNAIVETPTYPLGAEAGLVLDLAQHVSERPEHLEVVTMLRRYESLVEADEFDSEEALALRTSLQEVNGGLDPLLDRLDLSVRMRRARRKG